MRRSLLFGVLLLALLQVRAASQIAPGDIVIDDFSDRDLTSNVGWYWNDYAANDAETIQLGIGFDAQQNPHLEARGTIPQTSTGISWAGIYCIAEEGPDARANFTDYHSIAFRAATDHPGYYKVRIEQRVSRHDSTNVIFPLDDTMTEIVIPLSEFRTGVGSSYCINFSTLDNTPGAPFHLKIDDLRLLKRAPADMNTDYLKRVTSWEVSPHVAWENATFHNKPLLLYFASRFARPCRDFDERLLKVGAFAQLADRFVLCRADVAEWSTVAQQYSVFRVPSFMVFEPASGQSWNLGAGVEPDALAGMMEHYITNRTWTAPVAAKESRASQYEVVTIDSFSDANFLNEFGGPWGVYSAGDQGDILHQTKALAGGNVAIEAVGRYPDVAGATWGGLYVDMWPNRQMTFDLTRYRWLAFVCFSKKPGTYTVHVEDSAQGKSQAVAFNVGEHANRVTIAISDFGMLASRTAVIVWSEPNPTPGQEFHLVLDDVMIIR